MKHLFGSLSTTMTTLGTSQPLYIKDVAISKNIQGLSHCPHPTHPTPHPIQQDGAVSKTYMDISVQSPTGHAISHTNSEGTQPYPVILQNQSGTTPTAFIRPQSNQYLSLVCTYYNYQYNRKMNM